MCFKKFYILVVLTITLNGLYAQKKGDNTAFVSGALSISQVKSVLFSKGFIIEGSDTSFFATGPRSLKEYMGSVKMNFAKTDTGLIIKSFVRVDAEHSLFGVVIKNEFEPVTYNKRKNLYGAAWMELANLATAFNLPVTYKKE